MEPRHKSLEEYFSLHKYEKSLYWVALQSGLRLVVARINFEEPVVEDFLGMAHGFLVRKDAAVVIVQDFSIALILVLQTQFIHLHQNPKEG